MNYRDYVIAAYAVFVVVMLWDWIAPRLQLRQALRAARLQGKRNARGHPDRHPGESRDPS